MALLSACCAWFLLAAAEAPAAAAPAPAAPEAAAPSPTPSRDPAVGEALARLAAAREAPAREEAARALDEALQRAPGDVEAGLQLGQAWLGLERYQHALNAFSAVYLADMSSIPAMLGRARALAGLADLAKAAEWARKAAEARPDDPRAWEVLGEIYLDESQLEAAKAEAAFRELSRLDAERRAGPLGLARALSFQKKVDQAIEVLRAWVARHPEDTDARQKLAESLYVQDDLAGAAEMLDQVLAAEPARADAANLRSSIRTRKAIAFWVPVAAVVLVPLLALWLRKVRKGRVPKVGDDAGDGGVA
ncbi:MAG TPA: tetratricopeptide repeat protein [Myxococcota bacterium]|nr:tetratricopeptide repeat protein [Myxococcota bacterium]HRY91930.1 tetratricopeptide repeat protein [Myxococcota bacterium]HSA22285.1 tetratricopeptide repeat protein [Myxococcota bacterium]